VKDKPMVIKKGIAVTANIMIIEGQETKARKYLSIREDPDIRFFIDALGNKTLCISFLSRAQ
jgi:hypothetical protein